ncbi:MAG: glycosyltransferase, partial [Halobacteriaceae archaeon]
ATRQNIRVIPAPTPESNLQNGTTELRTELDLPQNKNLLLFFGGLRYEKGPDILASMAQDLDFPLVILYAGSPIDFDKSDVCEWKEAVSSPVNIINRLEYISDEAVDKYFAAADALVLPYRRTRGISGPLRRAAMVGTPIVGPTQSDIGELIEKNELGKTFSLGDSNSFRDALIDVLRKKRDRESALQEFAMSRRWTETGSALVEIYMDCLNTNP